MFVLCVIAAILLYLLPIPVVLAARSRADRELWEIALDLPFAVSLDLLGILVFARVFPLETAILISRPLWLAGGAAYLFWTRRRAERGWPSALGRRELVLLVAAAALAVLLSVQLSRPCQNADRHWHISLVASLQGQRIPFMNVYQPDRTLAYHFSGDILAAALQTLSFGVVHASNALSLAHDVTFGLTGASLALLLRWWGLRSLTGAALGALGVLLAGPITLLRADSRPEGGYNYIDYLRVSFRPHVCLAGLLLVGFVGAVVVRLRERAEPLPLRRTAPVLIACTALLAITDEASIGALGAALGVVWLFEPRVLHPKRLAGALVLGGLLLALVLPNLLFVAALAPGAPRHKLSLVYPRSPGYRNPPIPLSDPRGWEMLLHDLFPMVAVFAVGVAAWWRSKSREIGGGVLFLGALLAVSFFGLIVVDVDGLAIESHRFVSAAMFVSPIFGVAWISPLRRALDNPISPEPLAAALLAAALLLPAVSTLEWMRAVGPYRCDRAKTFFTTEDFFTTDCRAQTGARFGGAAGPEYVEKSIYYLYTGCNPTFTSGPRDSRHWEIKVGFPQFEYAALAELHGEMLRPDQPLPVICAAGGGESDPICARAKATGSCRPRSNLLVRCELTPAERVALLANRPK